MRFHVLPTLAAAACLAGCSTANPIDWLSTADNDAMYARAAAIIGVPVDQLTITNQVRTGDMTNFTATTSAGASYRCTVRVAYGQVNHITCPRT